MAFKLKTRVGGEGIRPYPCQLAVLDDLISWAHDDSAPQFASLHGYAGTGKSAVCGFLLRNLIDQHGLDWVRDCVLLLAPTHQACHEAEDKLLQMGVQLKFETLARALNMNEKHHPDGSISFIQKRPPEWNPYTKFVIVDESSMVNSYCYQRLLGALKDVSDARRVMYGLAETKLLLVGDPRQLPPVKEALNGSFKDPTFSTHTLSEVVRHDGPILEQCQRVLEVPACRPTFKTVGSGSAVWATGSRQKFEVRFIEALLEGKNNDQGVDAMALAYTNRRVKELTDLGRIALFGHNPPPFVVGEVLMSVKPIKQFLESRATTDQDNLMLAHSNTRMRVCQLRTRKVFPSFLRELRTTGYKDVADALLPNGVRGFRCWEINVVLLGRTVGHTSEATFTVVHSDDRDEFNAFTRQFASLIRNGAFRDKEKRELWAKYYYPLMAMNAPVQSSLAMTVYRSQGSTIAHTLVDLADIDQVCARNQRFWNAATYTAISRASERLSILEPRLCS